LSIPSKWEFHDEHVQTVKCLLHYLWTQQTSRSHTMNHTRARYLQLNNVFPLAVARIVPCWDKEHETLYRSFFRFPVGSDSDRAISPLLLQLDDKKQERWEEAVKLEGVEHHQQILRNDLYQHCYIQMGRNRLMSILAYHPFHPVPREPVDEIFLNSLIQPKDNTDIQY